MCEQKPLVRYLAPCKGVQVQSRILDLTPWIPDSLYTISVSVSGTWIPTVNGFRTLWAVFLILKSRFPVSIRKTFPNSSSKKFPGIRNPLHGMSYPILILRLRKGYLSDLNFSYILNNTSWFQLATPYYNERWCFCLKWLAEVKRSYLT